jgi:hypothetical protein
MRGGNHGPSVLSALPQASCTQGHWVTAVSRLNAATAYFFISSFPMASFFMPSLSMTSFFMLEGLSVVETAQLTGMSESAIKVGIHRGLKALANKIRALHENR